MMGEVLKKFGEKIHETNPSIERVTIGTGGKTPEEIRSFAHAADEGMFEGEQYADSKNQVELYIDSVIAENVQKLEEELGFSNESLQKVALSSVQITEIRALKESGVLDDIPSNRIASFLTPILM
jgi:hypothetical protein